jgi:trk system potassium uptake protein TrkA
MKVLIFGCGRTGAALARMLIKSGHEVTIVERDPRALIRLGHDHGCKTIIGDGLDEDILKKAGIESADAFITCTRGDNSNLMAAQIAKVKFKVPKICVKVNDPARAAEYTKIGLYCITPNLLTAGMMFSWLLDENYQTIENYNVIKYNKG